MTQDVAAGGSRGSSVSSSPTSSMDAPGSASSGDDADDGGGGSAPSIIVYAARYNSGLPYQGPVTVQLREYLPGSRCATKRGLVAGHIRDRRHGQRVHRSLPSLQACLVDARSKAVVRGRACAAAPPPRCVQARGPQRAHAAAAAVRAPAQGKVAGVRRGGALHVHVCLRLWCCHVHCFHRTAPHRTAPHRTAPHRTAPHRTAPHRTAPHRTAPHRTAQAAVADAERTQLPVVRLLGYLQAPPSDEAFAITADASDTIWMVCACGAAMLCGGWLPMAAAVCMCVHAWMRTHAGANLQSAPVCCRVPAP
jgi:hypothetical protein